MNEIILTVIGGGSVNWMRGLMRDIYLLDDVSGGEIRLVDPNLEHAEAVADMLRAFNKMRNKTFKITVTDQQKEGLVNADFVMTTFSPGSMDAFWNDLELPIKYGVRLPVSMTVGIPGISAALRTVPVAYEIVRDMEEVCPGAWLLNVTNPMSAVINAMHRAAKKTRIIGMCHEFHAFSRYMGPMLNLGRPKDMDVLTYLYKWLPEQGFDYTVAGVNHFIWLTKAEHKGQDVLPQIRQFSHENQSFKDYYQTNESSLQATPVYQNHGEAKLALCRQLGYLPLAGDRHLIEFYPSLCNLRNGFGMKYNVKKTTVDQRRQHQINNLNEIRRIAAGQEAVSWAKSGEEMTEIIKAILTDQKTTAIVNMPNQGQITNMPEGAIVETLAEVGKNGIKPKAAGDLPGAIGSLCRLHADVHELTVTAALTGSRELLIEALSLDPSSGLADFGELPELADELLMANKTWLPRFFK